MSIAGHLPGNFSGDPDKIFLKPPRRRNNSGELDVFEAAGYFSGNTDHIFREDHGSRRGGRMSLDLPIRTNVAAPAPPYTAAKPIKDPKKLRQQPSSPGGRLANFLNSLFNQSGSKKKKPKPKTELDHNVQTGGRKRRSSLSNLIDSKPGSNISGFRTPPVQTPNKNYSEIRNILDQKSKNILGIGIYDQVNRRQNSDREIGRMNGGDDGAESDSSSDLFELRIVDFDCYSSNELPVYETTNIQRIKRPSTLM